MRLRYSLIVALASVLMLAPSFAQAATGFVATLSALNEVPPNASPATGTATAILSDDGLTLSYTVTYSGLTANRTASHFHAIGCPGINAGVQLAIAGAGPTSDTITGSGPVNATLLTGLTTACSGGSVAVYLNVHSGNFPGGEIRGQLFPDVTPSRNVTWGRIKMLYR